MANRDLVAIGTSAGGVEALVVLAKGLRADFPASVLVTIHLPSDHRSELDQILGRVGPLPTVFASDGDVLRKARIYLAPPGRHLLVDGKRIMLGYGPRENHARPAIDPMLRAAAVCCANRSIGVVLTGTMGDGASGLRALKHAGGVTIVQDPKNAAYSEMPATALMQSAPDHIVHLAQIPVLLNFLVRQLADEPKPVADLVKSELEIARTGRSSMEQMDDIGRRSVLSCPDCGGVMWEIVDDDLIRYRCHVGHAFTADLMSVAHDEDLHRALATALRVLEERIALTQRLRQQANERHCPLVVANWAERARGFEQKANLIRDSIRRMDEMAVRFQQAAE
jgi:two-component system chemotaxis response regulator CheB